jgi:hypothetical protein
MRVIKCNPSWAACGRMLLEVVENGDSEAARQGAKDEIIRALKGYDAMLEKHTDYFEQTESEVPDVA